MSKAEKILSHSVEETLTFARKFARRLKPGDVVALTGNLGSGKTTFIKGLAAGLGLRDAHRVKSPTFVLMHVYPSKIPLYHFDLYRLETEKEITATGLEEFVHDPRAITCVEWAEKAGPLLPPSAYRIRLEIVGENERRFTLDGKRRKRGV